MIFALTEFPVLVDGGHISDQRLIELMSLNPAQLMGRHSTDIAALLNTSSKCAVKRSLNLAEVEHPELVDLNILNTTEQWSIDAGRFLSKARNTPFNGWDVSGKPYATIIASALVFDRLGFDEATETETGE